MRLIDADVLSEKILDVVRCVIPESEFTEGYTSGLYAVAEQIKEEPTIEQPKWIPVTEGLPETIVCSAGTAYSEAVIVWTSGRKAMIAVWNGVDFLCDADYWEAWGEEITHWMPLPQPPKGDE